MTPLAIRTGKAFESRAELMAADKTAVNSIAVADSNRVALSVAINMNMLELVSDAVYIGVKVSGSLVPLTVLTLGHPVCYLSIDKIGNILCDEIFALNLGADDGTVGVTTVRMVQPLPET